MPRPYLVGAALAAALLAARLAAGEPSEPLTLAEALRAASEASPDVLAARSAVAQAEAQGTIARTFPNPTLATSVSKIPTDGTSAATGAGNAFFDRSYDTIVSLAQPLEAGGKRKDRRLSAAAGVEGAHAGLGDAARRVAAAVATAYAGAVAAGEAAAVLEETADSLGKSAELARVREESGDVSLAERAQAEVAAGRARSDARTARASARSALLSLETLAGLPVDPEVPLATPLSAILGVVAPAGNGAEADDEACLGRRPDLLALQAAARKQEAELALQKAFRVPDPSILVQYEREPPDRSNSAGFGISFPLPLWNQNQGPVRAAGVALEAARLDVRRAEALARAELASTRETLAAAGERARRYRDELLPRAEQARETVAFAWSEGGASLLELLEAERSARDVRLAAIAADSDLVAARVAWLSARALPVSAEESR